MNKTYTLGTALAALTFSAVAPVVHDKVRRPARLFVAGEYPDKGVTVTAEDLTKIVANFNTAPNVPIKTEHTDTPLDPLGEVAALYVEGNELYGVLVFSAGVDQHIRERGVQHLSVSLVREEDNSFRLKETSLVFTPRVATAGFLSATAVQEKLASFAAQGKLTPAMRQSAERLLSVPQVINFADGSSVSVAAELDALFSAMPVVQPRGAVASTSFTQLGNGGPSAETKAFAKLFGVEPEKVHANLGGSN